MFCFRPGVLPGQLEHHEQEERQLKLGTLSLAMVLGNSIPTTPSERLLDCIGMPKTMNQTMDPRVVVPSWLIQVRALEVVVIVVVFVHPVAAVPLVVILVFIVVIFIIFIVVVLPV